MFIVFIFKNEGLKTIKFKQPSCHKDFRDVYNKACNDKTVNKEISLIFIFTIYCYSKKLYD